MTPEHASWFAETFGKLVQGVTGLPRDDDERAPLRKADNVFGRRQ